MYISQSVVSPHYQQHYPQLADCMVATRHHPHPEIAYALATCSGYAYAHADGRADIRTVASMMARMGLPANRCFAIELSIDAMYLDSTAFVIQSSDGKVVILCYRGSELFDLVDWLSDFDVEPEVYTFRFHGRENSANVHSGFFRSARATYDEVVDALKRASRGEPVAEVHEEYQPYDAGARLEKMEALYIAGHSLGGAVGTLTAVMLKQDPDPEVREIASKIRAIYTYGQPMVGSPRFAEQCRRMDGFFDRNLIRYIHLRDVVPHVPPRETGRFQHFGQEWLYRPRAGARSPSEEWTPTSRPTGQANVVEFPLLPFLLDYTARRTPVGRTFISGWNRAATAVDVLTARVTGAADGRGLRSTDQLRTLDHLLGLPFVYSMEDHAPHHYVAKLATPGVANEFH